MRFKDLLMVIRGLDLDDGPGSARRPPRDNVRRVPDALSARLADEEFYLDCLELELEAVTGADRTGSPMFRMRDRPLVFQMFYWLPGRIAAPHEHTRWTVTAVFFHRLQVTTYPDEDRSSVLARRPARAGSHELLLLSGVLLVAASADVGERPLGARRCRRSSSSILQSTVTEYECRVGIGDHNGITDDREARR